MKKKTGFLIPLLMAIVMMAMSPTRVWAQEVTIETDKGFYDDDMDYHYQPHYQSGVVSLYFSSDDGSPDYGGLLIRWNGVSHPLIISVEEGYIITKVELEKGYLTFTDLASSPSGSISTDGDIATITGLSCNELNITADNVFIKSVKVTYEAGSSTTSCAHQLTEHPAVAATCTTAGNSAYWSCSKCGKYFSDAEGKNEIAASSVVIPANHDDVRYDAANQKTYCESCGTTLATGTWIFLDGVNITIATDYDNTGDIMFSNGTMIVKEGATITHGVSVNAGGVLINYGSINMVAYNGGGTIYNHGYIKDYYNYSGENYNTGTYSSLEYPENKLTTCSHTNITPLGTVEATCTKPGGSLYECSTCYYRFVPEGSQIAALGHDLPAYDNGFATCNRCGEEIMQEPQSQNGILKIANLGNLYWFLEKLEKEPDTYNSAHLELTNDIVVNDGTFDTDGNFTATNASTTSTPRAWRKCVEQDRTFYGTVDGQGHEIKGLYFNDSQSYVYLFYDLGATDNKTATITNLGFTNVYCSAKNPPLFCHYNYGTISQCYVNGTIEGNGWSPTAFCYYNYGTISQCYTTGIRKNKDYPSASLCYHNYGTVTNSYSTCNLFGSETYGLIADNYGAITNCYFAGTLSATTNYGLCGIFKSGSSSTNCYTTYPTAYNSSNSAVHPTINTSVSAERLASGEITYLLNGSQDAGIWRQKLTGEDVNTTPVLKQTDDNKVYYGYADCEATEKTYVNIAHATQGHSITNYTYNNDATCVKNGTKTASCDNGCGTTDTKDDPEHPATGIHTLTHHPAKEATYTQNGNRDYWSCSVCNALFADAAGNTPTTEFKIAIPTIKRAFTHVEQYDEEIVYLGTAAFDIKEDMPATLTFDDDGNAVMIIGDNTVAKVNDNGALVVDFTTTLDEKELNKVSKEVSYVGYATLYSPFQLAVPAESDVKVYAPTYDESEQVLSLKNDNKVNGRIIPAGTGVMLKNEGSIDFTITSAAPTYTNVSALSGSAVKIDNPTKNYEVNGKTVYTLGKYEREIGFYRYKGNDLNPGLAYLYINTLKDENDAKGISLVFDDDMTSIKQISPLGESEGAVKYLQNGSIVIIKNGKKYNTNGQLIK